MYYRFSVLSGFVSCIISATLLGIASRNPADSLTMWLIWKLNWRRMKNELNGKRSLEIFLDETKRVEQCQRETLKGLLQKQKDTAIGRDFRFSSITSRDDYISTVPLMTYTDIEHYMDMIAEGELNIMTSDKLLGVCSSSGTTGKSKMLPASTYFLDEFDSIMAAITYVMSKKVYDPSRSLGRSLELIFRPTVKTTKGGLDWAPASYFYNDPTATNATPELIRQVSQEKTALYIHAVFGLAEPEVTFLSGLMSPLTYTFWKNIEDNWSQICDDIEKGMLSDKVNLQPELRKQFNILLSPSKKRADTLRREFSKGMVGICRRVWPRCKTARVLTTGSFANYAKLLRDSYMEGVPMLSEFHGASEGIIGIGISTDVVSQDYTFFPSKHNFYEFIAEEDVESTDVKTCYLEEVCLNNMWLLYTCTCIYIEVYG